MFVMEMEFEWISTGMAQFARSEVMPLHHDDNDEHCRGDCDTVMALDNPAVATFGLVSVELDGGVEISCLCV